MEWRSLCRMTLTLVPWINTLDIQLKHMLKHLSLNSVHYTSVHHNEAICLYVKLHEYSLSNVTFVIMAFVIVTFYFAN